MERNSKNNISIIYFSGSSCGACDAIGKKVQELLREYPKIIYKEINALDNLEYASKYNVFSLPILILFVEGKEITRWGRAFNLYEFEEVIRRYYEFLEM